MTQPNQARLVNPDGNVVYVGGATPGEQARLVQDEIASWGQRQAVRVWIQDTENTWNLAKDTLQDIIDEIDRPPLVGDPGFPTLNLALVEQQLQWVWTKKKTEARIIIGVADAVLTTVKFLARILEQSGSVELPSS